jgi:hypothetical protein
VATDRQRYGLLLFVLISTYLVSAFTGGRWVEAAQVALLVAGAQIALRAPGRHRQIARRLVIVTIIGSVIAVVLALSASPDLKGVASVWTGLMLLLTVVLMIDRVLTLETVTVQSIYAAVSAYLLIGLMFAAFFAGIYHFSSDQFFAAGQPGNTRTFQYFSFTTLTTLGYGDFTAASSGGRALAVLEALTGQVFLATLVARLVSAYRTPGSDSDSRG